MVLDGNTGYAINSNKSADVAYTTVGVDEIGSNAEVTATVYLDLQGRRVDCPQNGIFIKEDTLADGSVRISKVVVR